MVDKLLAADLKLVVMLAVDLLLVVMLVVVLVEVVYYQVRHLMLLFPNHQVL
mgnify:CR=1 FL=1